MRARLLLCVEIGVIGGTGNEFFEMQVERDLVVLLTKHLSPEDLLLHSAENGP